MNQQNQNHSSCPQQGTIQHILIDLEQLRRDLRLGNRILYALMALLVALVSPTQAPKLLQVLTAWIGIGDTSSASTNSPTPPTPSLPPLPLEIHP